MHKKILFILLLLSILSTTSFFAHPGGTDGSGGHTDHSTEEYHYHHGFPAHQHIDGTCPYSNEYVNTYKFTDSWEDEEEDTFDFYDFLDLLDNPIIFLAFIFILMIITYFVMYIQENYISHRINKLRKDSISFDNMCNAFSRLGALVKAFIPVILLLGFVIFGTIGWLIELFE